MAIGLGGLHRVNLPPLSPSIPLGSIIRALGPKSIVGLGLPLIIWWFAVLNGSDILFSYHRYHSGCDIIRNAYHRVGLKVTDCLSSGAMPTARPLTES